MSGSRNLWFLIAGVFSDIQRLCQEARALELRAQEAEKARREASTMHGLPAAEKGEPAGAYVVALREEIRSRLMRLKAQLAETLTEREAYYALFPLVVYSDELAQSATQGRVAAWPPLQREFVYSDELAQFATGENMGTWPPLQQELYEIDNGGERFYAIIDTLLKREETSPLIFEVFLLCLNDGFQGQYLNARDKIDEYKARLNGKLTARMPAVRLGERDGTQGPEHPVELVAFPYWYYAAAAAVVVGLFALLHFVSSFESLPPG
jgi:hypothetical protein